MIQFLIQWLKALFIQKTIPVVSTPVIPLIPQPMSIQPVPTPVPETPKYLWDTPQHAYHSTRLICDEMNLSVAEKNLICSCIYQESEFHKGAIGKPNHDGTIDYGLCQYNNGTLRGIPLWIGPGAAFRDINEVLSDPEKGVRIMIKTYQAGHLNWWASYSTGANKKWLLPDSPMWQLAA